MRRRGLRAAAGVVATAMIGAALAMLPAVAASAAISPSAGTSNFYWPSGGSILERTPSGAISSVPVTPSMTSLALDPTTGILYGVSGSGPALQRIAADGTTTNLGTPAGYTSTIFGSLAFDAQGHLWGVSAAGGAGVQVLSEIDVTTNTVIKAMTLSTGVGGDLAWVDGQLYGGISTIQRIDTTTGTVVTSNTVTGLFTPAYWSSQGHLYTFVSGTIREVIGRDTATPTLVTVATGITAPGDGAADPTAPNPFLNAADDDFTGTPVPASGGTTATVFDNDTNNGAALAPADVTPTITDDGGLTGATIAADGTITIPVGASAGTHTLTYQLCRTAAGQTAICDTADATVQVTPLPVVDAVDDDFTAAPVTAGTAGIAGNVFADDTVDGVPVTAAAVTAAITDDGGLSGAALTAAGDLTVPASAAPGTYTLAYQLCAVTAPTACDTATVAVRVVAADTPVPPPGDGTPGDGIPGAGTPGAGTPDGPSPIGPTVTGVTPVSDELASTGTDIGTAADATLGGVAAVIVGAALWLLTRRRRTARD